mgnify:FL=1
MRIITNLGGSYEVPENMIKEYYNDFIDYDRESINHVKDMIMLVFEIFLDEPELLEHNEYKDDLIRAFAMRQALMEHGKFYDA